MRVSYFVSYATDMDDTSAFVTYYLERHGPLLRSFPKLRRLEVFTLADRARDPLLDDEAGPFLVAQMTFDGLEDLEAAVVSPQRVQARDDMANFPPFSGEVRHQAMACEPFPLSDADDDAPIVYHVQYHRPAPDEDAFVDHYRRHHPPILATFPRIRKVAVYTPLRWWDAPFVSPNDLMLINEVAFDTAEDLDAALASGARQRARADYESFPKFDGPVSHTPMRRHVLLR